MQRLKKIVFLEMKNDMQPLSAHSIELNSAFPDILYLLGYHLCWLTLDQQKKIHLIFFFVFFKQERYYW